MTPPESRSRMGGPRAAGIAIVALSLLVGVVAAISIPNPKWGIGAAVLLAFASVGALAGLLLAQRATWADNSWPPGMRDSDTSAGGARRRRLVYGIFLPVLALAAVVGLLVDRTEDPTVNSRAWVIIVVFGLIGIVCVVQGLRPLPVSVLSSERPLDDSAVEAGDWVRLGSKGYAPGSQLWATAVGGRLGLQ